MLHFNLFDKLNLLQHRLIEDDLEIGCEGEHDVKAYQDRLNYLFLVCGFVMTIPNPVPRLLLLPPLLLLLRRIWIGYQRQRQRQQRQRRTRISAMVTDHTKIGGWDNSRGSILPSITSESSSLSSAINRKPRFRNRRRVVLATR
jgi:hypothetical protein